MSTRTPTNQNTFPQRIGQLIETAMLEKYSLRPNKRQQKMGHYDGYDANDIYEIKAGKDRNPFRLKVSNHKTLDAANGSYILARYHLINRDAGLTAITDIEITDITVCKARDLEKLSKTWKTDTRKNVEYIKVTVK